MPYRFGITLGPVIHNNEWPVSLFGREEYFKLIQVSLLEHLFYFKACARIYVTKRLRNMRRDVFQAIADPTRRAILSLLASQKLTLNQIASHFSISRPAVSKHIKILVECELVVVRQQGRERYCEVKAETLNEVSDWVEQYRQIWEQRFDRLDEYLQEIQKKEKPE